MQIFLNIAIRLLAFLDKRVKKDPALFVLYRNGRVVAMDRSDQGVSKLKSMAVANTKKRLWDKFAVYTLANRAYLNDVEALATRIAMSQKIALKNFAKAKNTTEDVKRDINKWASSEVKTINRSLSPLEHKYRKGLSRLDAQEKKLRKSFMKKIDRAKGKSRRKSLRAQRDKRIEQLRMQRKRLAPLRKSILSWQAKLRSFDSVKF